MELFLLDGKDGKKDSLSHPVRQSQGILSKSARGNKLANTVKKCFRLISRKIVASGGCRRREMAYYLIFNHSSLTYGLPAEEIQEVFFIPELTPIPDAPEDIVGVINLRGEILPIMDLNIRFGYETNGYQISDTLVVVRHEELKVGLITNHVDDVGIIEEENITPELPYDRGSEEFKQEKFIKGVAKKEDKIIFLLDTEKLLRYVEPQTLSLELDLFQLPADGVEKGEKREDTTTETEESQQQRKYRKTDFFPNITEDEKRILRERASRLRQSIQFKDFTGLKPVAVFSLNQEYFGVELSLVREFIKFKKYTPIPCTPEFVVGNINLRGEVITLIDIRREFNLTPTSLTEETPAIVVNVDGIVAGIVVDEIKEIAMINPQQLQKGERSEEVKIQQEYLQGVIPYQEKMLAIINLAEIMSSGKLIVDEAV
ncbi:MAG: chemotaxis protein CheW [Geminocystis sp.]|nr:chemotaxis protein CheW [Geminocystis sp.]MCS7147087.1 chemotaxis protein CheW [Geminocystis sp.]